MQRLTKLTNVDQRTDIINKPESLCNPAKDSNHKIQIWFIKITHKSHTHDFQVQNVTTCMADVISTPSYIAKPVIPPKLGEHKRWWYNGGEL